MLPIQKPLNSSKNPCNKKGKALLSLPGGNRMEKHLFYPVKPRPSPHSGIFDRRAQSELGLPEGDRSIDGVME